MLPERGCVLHGFTESAFFDVSSRRSGFVRCVCSLQSVRKVQGPWSWGQKSAHRRARKIRKCRFRFCGAVFEACCDRSCSKTRPNAKEIGRRGRPTDNVRPKVPCGRTGTMRCSAVTPDCCNAQNFTKYLQLWTNCSPRDGDGILVVLAWVRMMVDGS